MPGLLVLDVFWSCCSCMESVVFGCSAQYTSSYRRIAMVEHTSCFEIARIKRPLDELTAGGVIKQLAAEFEVHTDIDIDGNQLLCGALSTGTPPLGWSRN